MVIIREPLQLANQQDKKTTRRQQEDNKKTRRQQDNKTTKYDRLSVCVCLCVCLCVSVGVCAFVCLCLYVRTLVVTTNKVFAIDYNTLPHAAKRNALTMIHP